MGREEIYNTQNPAEESAVDSLRSGFLVIELAWPQETGERKLPIS